MPSKEKVGCKQKTGRNVAEKSMEHLHTLTATMHLCAILAVSPIRAVETFLHVFFVRTCVCMLCVQYLHKYCLYMHTYMFMDIICMYGRRQKFGHILFLQNNKSFLCLCKNVQKWNRME